MKIIRWIIFIPIGIVVSVICVFLLHLILYRTLSGGSEPLVTPYPELPERLLTPFITALAFVWSACYLVPSHKFKVSLFLSGVLIFGFGATFAMGLFNVDLNGLQLTLQYGGLNNFLGVVGSALGSFIVWKKETMIEE